jgi:hypothetical protein
MDHTGDKFTWRRGKIRERLDRSVSNVEWHNMFPFAALVNEGMTKSDYHPVVVNSDYYNSVATQSRTEIQARCLEEPSVEEIINAAWNKAKHADKDLMSTLVEVHDNLHKWDKHILKGPKEMIDTLKKSWRSCGEDLCRTRL